MRGSGAAEGAARAAQQDASLKLWLDEIRMGWVALEFSRQHGGVCRPRWEVGGVDVSHQRTRASRPSMPERGPGGEIGCRECMHRPSGAQGDRGRSWPTIEMAC